VKRPHLFATKDFVYVSWKASETKLKSPAGGRPMPDKSQSGSIPKSPGDPSPESGLVDTGLFKPDTPHGRPRPAGVSGTAESWIGKALGKYQVTGVLGQGGMGIVLKARDLMIERDVAIKVLGEAWAADPSALGRFLSEARAAGKLNHPNVTAIYEVCQDAGMSYLVLEFLPGGSLGDRLEKHESVPVLEATQALIDACKGVGAAHAAGLIHRDIKPANFMRAADGSIKVADFGLAKGAADVGLQFTQTGTVVGTPSYMSPEQCECKPLDHRTDIYSLGATYYSLLTGKSPYHESVSSIQLMYLHCHGPVPDPRSMNDAVPEACSRIIARAMAKAPADRYQSAGEMLADLQAVAAGLSEQTPLILPSQRMSVLPKRPSRKTELIPFDSRRVGWAAAGFSLLVLVGLAIAFWGPWRKSPDDLRGTGDVELSGGPPIKVGVLHPQSGTMANEGRPLIDATLLAIDQINENGGLLRRNVEAVVRDTQSDPDTADREAEKLIVEDRVSAIFGIWLSATRRRLKPTLEKHDHLLVYPLHYEGMEQSPNILYNGTTPNQQIIPTVRYCFGFLNKRRFFLVGSDYIFPHAANAVIADELKTLGGKVVGEEYIPLGSGVVDDVVRKIAAGDADVILSTITGDSNRAFLRALRARGVKSDRIPMVSFSLTEHEIRAMPAKDTVGDYAAWSYFQSIERAENYAFVQQFRTKYGAQRTVSDPMETAYYGVHLWAKAVRAAGSDDVSPVRKALRDQRYDAPEGEVRIDPDTLHTWKTVRLGKIVEGGQIEIVWSSEKPIKPELYPSSRSPAEWDTFLENLYKGWGNRWAAP
jgi:urea transport system substrate-binding protein